MTHPADPQPDNAGPAIAQVPDKPVMRRVLAAFLAAIPLLALLMARLTVLPYAPEAIPSHFGPRGVADAWANTSHYWLTIVIVVGVLTAGAVIAAIWMRHQFRAIWLLVGSAGAGAFAGSLWFFSLRIAQQQPHPELQRMGWSVWGALALGAVMGGVVYLAYGRPQAPSPAARSAPPVMVAAGERVGSVQYVRSNLMVVIGIVTTAVMLLATLMVWPQDRDMGILLAVAGLASLLLISTLIGATVTADARGLCVISWLGIPIMRIALADMAAVYVQQIDPA